MSETINVQEHQYLKDFTCDFCNQSLQYIKYDPVKCSGWICDICNTRYTKEEKVWHCSCQKDGFDVCNKCFSKKDSRIKQQFTCDYCCQNLQPSNNNDKNFDNIWICDICKTKFNGKQQSWNCLCQPQGFDVCVKCYQRQDQRKNYWDNLIQEKHNINQSLNPQEQQKNNLQVKNLAKQKKAQQIKDDSILSKASIFQSLRNSIQLTNIEENNFQKQNQTQLDQQQKMTNKSIDQDLNDSQQSENTKDIIQMTKYVEDFPYQSKFQTEKYGLYTGQMINGLRNGKGITIWDDGIQQLGNFENDLLHGYGEIHSTTNDNYKGEFKYGEFNGHGVLQYKNGDIYIGDFKDHN
ncbi:hypothetical protein PPERSA_01439 [Pseudocohnilembus persalinus]|uniref:Uncharacterized protein n=1 Tax=Pseudocohnilembus persalinus TaxID=266149 RepID=A0A0V0QHL3_PSEPJ|nr:hypothetical protein PPERSA_01439 [Pseudocohnilembus persalinus]|eukprot:KRX01536.1 hypothetical protein PPERSA_01439 [Pseudocohnilembus persalinus]